MAKPPRDRDIQLDYIFDRLLAAKLAQVYEILVPDKTWLMGEQPTTCKQENVNELNSTLCTSLIGSAETGEDHREPDSSVDRKGSEDGLHRA